MPPVTLPTPTLPPTGGRVASPTDRAPCEAADCQPPERKRPMNEPTPEPIDPETLQAVLDGYQACATWSTVPLSAIDSDRSFDDLRVCDWTPEADAECRADCERFIRENLAALLRVTDASDYTWERVGHDLWLSRNGHGAGFFGRVRSGDPREDDFDALQAAASALGEVVLDTCEEADADLPPHLRHPYIAIV
jgi:hypothetical protein